MNLIETGLAFAEGLALIASPCILPVLPLVLSASIDGGKRRPFGIIVGFVLAFSAFALASRSLVQALGVDPGIVRNVSLALLLGFAVVLFSEKLSEKFGALTQGAANFGGRFGAGGKGGFFSGLGIGALIGLVWTPCAGPVMAAVLVQVVRQASGADSFILIAAFALGAGLPMLAFALAGRGLMGRVSFLAAHARAIRKGFAVLIVLAVAFIASGIDVQALFPAREVPVAAAPASAGLQHGLKQPYAAPEFAKLQWLNSPPLTMAQLKGKVVLVDFWTYSCINCVRTLPYLTGWDREYRDKGLVIVSIHSPEFAFEKDAGNVRKALARHGIAYPVALDNDYGTWDSFKNQYWPAHYLIGRDGNVVYTHFGEGDYGITESNIRYLLGLKPGTAAAAPQAAPFMPGQTPETYLGYKRARNYAGTAIARDETAAYAMPPALALNEWALGGAWKAEGDRIVAQEAGAALRLHFRAGKVFLVMGTASGRPVRARILLDGKPPGAAAGRDAPGGEVTVSGNTLYELAGLKAPGEGTLEIRAEGPGLEAYAFTFGN
jgi:cytochrome c biogenesis protein CcdA/thiol-disulfide isomerase/thioredoxin